MKTAELIGGGPFMLTARRAAVVACLILPACEERRATRQDCRAILDRIVELELGEMGFRDPKLAERRKQQIHQRYRNELEKCTGRALPEGALECVAQAKTTEELSHGCLR